MQGGIAWSCLNLIWHALLTPMGGLTLLYGDRGVIDEGVGRREVGEYRRRGEGINCGWYVN